MTGQKVNLGKSHIIFCADVSHKYRSEIKRRLQMSECRYPIQYLGVAIGMKRLPLSAFNQLLERIRLKLGHGK